MPAPPWTTAIIAHLKRVFTIRSQSTLNEKGWFTEECAQSPNCWPLIFPPNSACMNRCRSTPAAWECWPATICKSASRDRPAAGRHGLLYRNGYFQQYLTADGWRCRNPTPNWISTTSPLEPQRYTDGSPVHVHSRSPRQRCILQSLEDQTSAAFPLYLLDTNLQENSPADRDIAAKLYGSGTDLRIKQEWSSPLRYPELRRLI